ncbi:MAG: tRNA pseudouridine(55) synthase TruB [Rickettsiales bacterium]|jgi:tRNA pseudouridine55 synthase|nr:tRNA pseudouridine(55) synthase TruB [Rickettsiales bacterium]
MLNSGFVFLDKPSGISSRAAGARVAKMFGVKKFGHIGTLDPFASGLLIIALGEATKIIPYLPDADKEYEFSIKFGIRTNTDDITGAVVETRSGEIDNNLLNFALEKLTGEIEQTPPNYSAVHIDGVRAYKLANAGRYIKMPTRRVKIYELKQTGENKFFVRCGGGTYVRSLVRDIAENCGQIGVCETLRRVATNGVKIKDAHTLDFLENMFNNKGCVGLNDFLMPVDFGLGDIPVWNLEITDAGLFCRGGFIQMDGADTDVVRVYLENELVGIGKIDGGELKPKRILQCR